jgi:predicted transcriptional regulator
MPIGRLIGEFDIDGILSDDPEALWQATKSGAGVAKDYYDAYFAGRQVAHAIQIGELRLFDPEISPGDVIDDFTPPQSFMYVGGKGHNIYRRTHGGFL